MIPPFAEIVEVAPLWEAIWTSAAFGLAVLAITAIGVTASLRAGDQRREHHEGALAAYSAVTILCACCWSLRWCWVSGR
jgi:hypothetical protein